MLNQIIKLKRSITQMKTKRNVMTILMVLLAAFVKAGDEFPSLRVSGNQLVDDKGKAVVLHGVMDTPNRYFNGWRWQSWKATYGDEDVQPCLDYFEKLFTAITDHSQGAYCNVFRLHLDPCWTNDPAKPLVGEGGEHNISQFSSSRLTRYWARLYSKIMESALAHGLYVVIRPPGVCPNTIKVGDDYQNYLKTVWGQITKAKVLQENAGHVSIELANEPIEVRLANGSESNTAMRDFFQPIVDVIRDNGFTGIIWVPGSGWQSNYIPYDTYPIQDDNFGYAVHCYPGWYESGSNNNDNTDKAKMLAAFKRQVPVYDTNPIIVTEIDWSPNKPGEGHYDEHGNWVNSNYGTWGTATTSGFGNAFRYIHDTLGNVSMTLQGTGLYIDIDKYLDSGIVQPAFQGVDEACGEACFKWYKEFYEASTSVEGVELDDPTMSSAKIFDLQGRRIDANHKGICIIKSDGMGKKVLKTSKCNIR